MFTRKESFFQILVVFHHIINSDVTYGNNSNDCCLFPTIFYLIFSYMVEERLVTTINELTISFMVNNHHISQNASDFGR